MNEIDSLTLKLLTTKKRYNNYLANANPDKSAEIQEYKEKVQKNTWRIKKLIGRYLDNPETQISNEIDDMMESCFRTLFKHFEMQDFEEKCAKHGYDATDLSVKRIPILPRIHRKRKKHCFRNPNLRVKPKAKANPKPKAKTKTRKKNKNPNPKRNPNQPHTGGKK